MKTGLESSDIHCTAEWNGSLKNSGVVTAFIRDTASASSQLTAVSFQIRTTWKLHVARSSASLMSEAAACQFRQNLPDQPRDSLATTIMPLGPVLTEHISLGARIAFACSAVY